MEDPDTPKTHRGYERPRRPEPEPRYDTEDSSRRTRSNKQKSERHGVDSYASDGFDSHQAWPAEYSSSRRLDEDEFVKQTVDMILREVPSSRSAGYYETDPRYPLPDTDNRTFSDANGYPQPNNFTQHASKHYDGEMYDLSRDTYYPPGYDPNGLFPLPDDGYDSAPPRKSKGADRHPRLLEAPSDKVGRRRRH